MHYNKYEEAGRASMISKRINYVSIGFGSCFHLTFIFSYNCCLFYYCCCSWLWITIIITS